MENTELKINEQSAAADFGEGSAEDAVTISDGEKASQSGGADSFGKFKSAEELLKAYNCLEAEFTRRSQQLKQLEGEIASKPKADKTAEPTDAVPVSEKLSRGNDIDEFKARYPEADIGKLKQIIAASGDYKEGCLDRAYVRYLLDGKKENDGEKFLERALSSEDVKKAVIVDYLKSVIGSKPKAKLMDGGAPAAMPPFKPKTLQEAGLMVKDFLNIKN